MTKYPHKGYTLVEIMIVVSIIAAIVAIILPNYLKASRTSARNVCINNLKQIDGAVERWALDYNIPSGIVPSSSQEEEVYGYIESGMPRCPSGGVYTIHAVGSKPQVTCSREDEGHVLP